MLYDSFDEFLEPEQREANKGNGGLYPPRLRKEIDAMNEWVYHTVNNGVYKCGFARTQEAYDENIYPLFKSLDRLEAHLGQTGPYLFGGNITEADIRLYTTMIRFDAAYHTLFKCNLKMIRHDYPRLSKWLRNLYWDVSERTNGGAFKKTTFFEIFKYGYVKAALGRTIYENLEVPLIVPRGPVPDIEPLTDGEEQELIHGPAKQLNGLTILDHGAGIASPTSNNPFSASGSGMGAMFGTDGDASVVGTMTASTIGSPSTKGQEDDGETGFDEHGEFHPKKMIKRRTTYNEENEKWYKAAKKAEKKANAPYIHLAL
jgi:hypothetical protein